MKKIRFRQLVFLFNLLLIALNGFGQDDETIQKANNFYVSGVFNYENQNYNRAITAFINCNNLISNPTTWYYLGLCYKIKKDWSHAFNAMETALNFSNPKLIQKFMDDAISIKKRSQDELNGTVVYSNSGSGDALSRSPTLPAKKDNPFANQIKMNVPRHEFKILTDRIIFPGMGVRNENQTIGDFCCTGETATILREDNLPIGYIYFYGTEAATENESAKFKIFVSAVPSINSPDAQRVQDEISFDAVNELFNNATKSKIVGGLNFAVTILSVEKTGRSFFDEGLRIQVDISSVQ